MTKALNRIFTEDTDTANKYYNPLNAGHRAVQLSFEEIYWKVHFPKPEFTEDCRRIIPLMDDEQNPK